MYLGDDDLQNNLFHYATSELSQDAFICWLLSHAMPEYEAKDPELTKCAKAFLHEFINENKFAESKCKLADNELVVKDIRRQYAKIDIAVLLNNSKVIIIEDKTVTSDYKDKLDRYRKTIQTQGFWGDKAEKPDFCKDESPYCVYFKTGFQSNFKDMVDSKYHVCDRKKILKLLKDCKSTNAIFHDFRALHEKIDEEALLFESENVENWCFNGNYGFLDWLITAQQSPVILENLDFKGYGYINNPSGGFFLAWFGSVSDRSLTVAGVETGLYIQINNKGKCYEITIRATTAKNKNDHLQVKTSLEQLLTSVPTGFSRKKPIRNGNSWAFAIYKDTFDNFEKAKEILPKAITDYKAIRYNLSPQTT